MGQCTLIAYIFDPPERSVIIIIIILQEHMTLALWTVNKQTARQQLYLSLCDVHMNDLHQQQKKTTSTRFG